MIISERKPLKLKRKKANQQQSNSNNFKTKIQQIFNQTRQLLLDQTMFQQNLSNQRLLYCAILNRKSLKFQQKNLNIQQFTNQLNNLDENIKNIYEVPQKDIIQYKTLILQKIIPQFDLINYIKTRFDNYLCYLIRIVCNKKPQNFIMKLFGKDVVQYNNEDIKKINIHFQQQLEIIQYKDKTNFSQNFQIDLRKTYIYKSKGQCHLLYPNFRKIESNQVKIKKQQKLSADDLQKIFNQKKNLQKTNNGQKKLSINKFFPNKISCATCQKQHSQFDSLTWNYMNYCQQCLRNPSVNTSNIPKNLMEKFFRQRNIVINSYSLQCSQCQGITVLKNYNPTNKPKIYICNLCEKRICIQHSCMVQSCFCYCLACKFPTITVSQMNLNVCQKCHQKLCLRCSNKSKKFCKCICTFCLGDNKQGHICQKKCHTCMNALPTLKKCKCQLQICRGCYYHALQTSGKQKFVCRFIEYS